MGLDMYLSVREYVSRNDYGAGWDNKVERPQWGQVLSATNIKDYLEKDSIYGMSVTAVAAYWRKANAIHDWFVHNVQDGVDNCREYPVSDTTLQELSDICKDVLAHKNDHAYIEEVLPPAGGFFFGSTEIDEWFFEHIEYTSTRIDEILTISRQKAKDNIFVDFTYQSSW